MTARDSYTCPKCSKTAFPGFVLSNVGKLIAQCPNVECLFEDQSVGPSDFNRGVASVPKETGIVNEPGWGGKTATVVDTSARATTPALPASRSGAPAMPHPPVAPTDVIGMIEDRAMWLSAEDARLSGVIAQAKAQQAGVRAENKSLQRMLRAAHRVPKMYDDDQAQVALRLVAGDSA